MITKWREILIGVTWGSIFTGIVAYCINKMEKTAEGPDGEEEQDLDEVNDFIGSDFFTKESIEDEPDMEYGGPSLEEADLALGPGGDRVIFTMSDEGEVITAYFSEDDMNLAREIAESEGQDLDDVILETIAMRYQMVKVDGLDLDNVISEEDDENE